MSINTQQPDIESSCSYACMNDLLTRVTETMPSMNNPSDIEDLHESVIGYSPNRKKIASCPQDICGYMAELAIFGDKTVVVLSTSGTCKNDVPNLSTR